MNHTVHFIVDIEPRGWAQPRMVTRKKGGELLKTPIMVPDKANDEAKAAIYRAAKESGLHVFDDSPGVVVTVLGVKPRPQSRPSKVPKVLWDAGGLCPAPVKPDADNLAKLVLDGISGKGVKLATPCWRDDADVVCVQSWTCYAEENGTARIEVWVREVSSTDWPFKQEVML